MTLRVYRATLCGKQRRYNQLMPRGANPDAARTTKPPLLSVVVPAYNEALRLGGAVKRITEYLGEREWTYEVLVVDDGSSDGTADAIRDRLTDNVRVLTHGHNLGKGAAVRTGVLASRGTWILLTDADLSAPIEELAKLMKAANDADLVYASRALPESRIEAHQSPQREVLGRLFNLFARRLLRLTKLHDTQCGFKLCRGEAARRLFPRLRAGRFAFDVELGWEAERAGYRVREVGVVWRDSEATSVRPWRDGTRMVIDLLWLRARSLIRQ